VIKLRKDKTLNQSGGRRRGRKGEWLINLASCSGGGEINPGKDVGGSCMRITYILCRCAGESGQAALIGSLPERDTRGVTKPALGEERSSDRERRKERKRGGDYVTNHGEYKTVKKEIQAALYRVFCLRETRRPKEKTVDKGEGGKRRRSEAMHEVWVRRRSCRLRKKLDNLGQ